MSSNNDNNIEDKAFMGPNFGLFTVPAVNNGNFGLEASFGAADFNLAYAPEYKAGITLSLSSAVTRDQVAERCVDEGEDVVARTKAMVWTTARRRERGECESESESEDVG
ncbi:hypothetical protein DFH08DRAFT_807142 [Mycena albidolilacea]|uniref:Uncharacterized protein n=1 Tax=Mycena albidolilacea TaxID=1033008 RepID=A0AAD7ETJ4_9AGAR|nr:hypothetical protein DFH08DRAFT_807142 [Mycena albidolilacea]